MLKDFSNLLLVVLCDYGEYGENTPSHWHCRETNALMLATPPRKGRVGQPNSPEVMALSPWPLKKCCTSGVCLISSNFNFNVLLTQKKKEKWNKSSLLLNKWKQAHYTYLFPVRWGLPHSHDCPVICCTGFPITGGNVYATMPDKKRYLHISFPPLHIFWI